MLSPRTLHLRRAKPLLGTVVEIALYSEVCSEEALFEYSTEAFHLVSDVQRKMSFFEAGSDIGRLNAAKPSTPVRIEPETYSVLHFAGELYRESQGAFDIFSRSREEYPQVDLQLLQDNSVLKSAPALVDLGGIAKGFAVDRAVEYLIQNEGISGVVNAGGDIRFFGGQFFPFTVRSPQFNGDNIDVGSFKDCAVATSVFGCDPSTKLSYSVIARSCMVADALTKAIAASSDTIRTQLVAKYDADFFEWHDLQPQTWEIR